VAYFIVVVVMAVAMTVIVFVVVAVTVIPAMIVAVVMSSLLIQFQYAHDDTPAAERNQCKTGNQVDCATEALGRGDTNYPNDNANHQRRNDVTEPSTGGSPRGFSP